MSLKYDILVSNFAFKFKPVPLQLGSQAETVVSQQAGQD
jgi:hypothetical protein